MSVSCKIGGPSRAAAREGPIGVQSSISATTRRSSGAERGKGLLGGFPAAPAAAGARKAGRKSLGRRFGLVTSWFILISLGAAGSARAGLVAKR
jgi:hypothetical protein